LERWILYPRTVDTEGDLRCLIYQSTEESGEKNIVSLSFIDTPEKENGNDEKESFLAKVSDGLEEEIEHAAAHLRYQIKNVHSFAP
jgi:hypothetical protein